MNPVRSLPHKNLILNFCARDNGTLNKEQKSIQALIAIQFIVNTDF